MKHVLPRLVRPQMPGWPWKFSSSSNAVFLGRRENAYQLKVNGVHMKSAQELSHPAY